MSKPCDDLAKEKMGDERKNKVEKGERIQHENWHTLSKREINNKITKFIFYSIFYIMNSKTINLSSPFFLSSECGRISFETENVA